MSKPTNETTAGRSAKCNMDLLYACVANSGFFFSVLPFVCCGKIAHLSKVIIMIIIIYEITSVPLLVIMSYIRISSLCFIASTRTLMTTIMLVII